MSALMHLGCLALLVYSLPLLVVHLAPMTSAWMVLRPGVWWRKQRLALEIHFAIEEILVSGEGFAAARTMMLGHMDEIGRLR